MQTEQVTTAPKMNTMAKTQTVAVTLAPAQQASPPEIPIRHKKLQRFLKCTPSKSRNRDVTQPTMKAKDADSFEESQRELATDLLKQTGQDLRRHGAGTIRYSCSTSRSSIRHRFANAFSSGVRMFNQEKSNYARHMLARHIKPKKIVFHSRLLPHETCRMKQVQHAQTKKRFLIFSPSAVMTYQPQT
jgi:hypothetical protein